MLKKINIASLMLAGVFALTPAAGMPAVYAAQDTKTQETKAQETKTQEKQTTAGKETESQAPAETEAPAETASMAEQVQGALKSIPNSAVFLVRVGYEFSDGSFDEWARGSGVAVNDTAMLTSAYLADPKNGLYRDILATQRTETYRQIGISLTNESNTLENVRMIITDTSGNEIAYGDVVSKNGMAVVTLSKTRSAYATMITDEEYMPADSDMVMIKAADNGNEKCTIVESVGSVSGVKDNTSFNCKITGAGLSYYGAPVINENGELIGMVSYGSDELVSFPVSSIKAFLSENGIRFITTGQLEENAKTEEESRTQEELQNAEVKKADATALENAIAAAEALDRSEYKTGGLETLDAAVKNGKDLLETGTYTQAEIDASAKAITDAMDGLQTKGVKDKAFGLLTGGKLKTILPVAGGIIFLAILLRMLKNLKKQAAEETEEEVQEPDTDYSVDLNRSGDLEEYAEEEEERPVRPKDERPAAGGRRRGNRFTRQEDEFEDIPDDEGLDITDRKTSRKRVRREDQPGLTYAESDEDKVSVLKDGQDDDDDDDGSAGTTVLSAGMPYLIRKDNGRRIDIAHDSFVLGKERSKVDYCISGNKTVSRTHCRIRKIGGECYIEDLKSMNFTFLNGKQLPEYQAALLRDGDSIRLSNVEFEFHTKEDEENA